MGAALFCTPFIECNVGNMIDLSSVQQFTICNFLINLCLSKTTHMSRAAKITGVDIC